MRVSELLEILQTLNPNLPIGIVHNYQKDNPHLSLVKNVTTTKVQTDTSQVTCFIIIDESTRLTEPEV